MNTLNRIRSLSVAALATAWMNWLASPSEAEAAGGSARRALEGDRGAARRSAALLESLLR